jgi:hypothetical protein
MREKKLLFVSVFLRIALFAHFASFLGFLAALVLAFLARLLGFFAAALGVYAHGRGENGEGTGNHREQFDALHIGPMILLSCKTSLDFGLTPDATGRLAVQFVPAIWADLRGFCQFWQ